MPPGDPAAAGPHASADLSALVLLLREVAAARIAVDERAGAELLSVSPKTLSRIPARLVGRFKIGTAVRYRVESLRRYVDELSGSN